jgi:cell division septal protein FtsQ
MPKYRRSRRIKRKTPFFKKKIFWIFFLSFLFFSGNFYLAIFSKFFQIQQIEILGSEKLKEVIKDLVEPEISKNFFTFETKSIFLFEQKKLVQAILSNFPQVERVEFLKEFPNKLKINIKEREAVALFCSLNCYLIDSNGIAFEEFFGKEDFKIEKLNKEEISLGEVVIDKENLNKILKIKKELEELQIPLEKVVLVNEERINVKTKEGWEIYFNPKRDIDWQLTKLKVLFEKEIPKEKRENLEYIELRFGNFAPYKYRQ